MLGIFGGIAWVALGVDLMMFMPRFRPFPTIIGKPKSVTQGMVASKVIWGASLTGCLTVTLPAAVLWLFPLSAMAQTPPPPPPRIVIDSNSAIPSTPPRPELRVTPPPSSQQTLDVSESRDTFRYTLGAGDAIKIDVFNVAEFSGNHTIAPDGTVNLSLIGSVRLEGLTLEEATATLKERLQPFLVRNIVNVSLVDPRPLNIAIVGEVNRPGPRFLTYLRSGGTQGGQIATLTRAIEAAGGITPRADMTNILISRRDGNQGRRLIKANLVALLERGDISQDLRILDGDSILVPRIEQNAASQPRQVSTSTFSPDTYAIQVALVGEVNRIGPQTLVYSRLGSAPTGLNTQTGVTGQATQGGPVTLSRALQAAGGITEVADIRNIQIGRLDERGNRNVFKANLLDLITKADLSQDITLTDGDLITVPRLEKVNPNEYREIARATFSPTSITVQVIGEVSRSGPLQLRPNSSFTEAITFAGGITNNGDWRAVELYRFNADGSVVRRDLVADLNLPQNEQSNPGLRDRDVIVVRPSFGASILESTTRFLGNIVSPYTLVNNLFRR
jgi:polysaccharide export outer membrane protein